MLQIYKNEAVSPYALLKENGLLQELQFKLHRTAESGIYIKDSESAAEVFRQLWDEDMMLIQEEFACIYMDRQCQVIGFRKLNTGMLHQVEVDISLLYAGAILSRCASVIVCHNHPSGALKFSKADEKLTLNLYYGLQSINIRLYDSIVLTDKSYRSMAESGFYIFNDLKRNEAAEDAVLYEIKDRLKKTKIYKSLYK